MRKASDLDARKVKSPNPESRNRGTFTRTKARGERERDRERGAWSQQGFFQVSHLVQVMLHGTDKLRRCCMVDPRQGCCPLLEGSVRDCRWLLIGCACNNWSVSTCKQVFIVSSVWGSSQICYVLLVGILKIDSASGTLVPKVLVRVYIYTHMWHTSLCVGNRLYRGVITVLFYRIIPYYITYIEHTSYMYI